MRVYARGAKSRSVSLMFNGGEPGIIRIPSAEHLKRCLPDSEHLIDQYVLIVRELGADIERIKGQQRMPIAESVLRGGLPRLIPVIKQLAGV